MKKNPFINFKHSFTFYLYDHVGARLCISDILACYGCVAYFRRSEHRMDHPGQRDRRGCP